MLNLNIAIREAQVNYRTKTNLPLIDVRAPELVAKLVRKLLPNNSQEHFFAFYVNCQMQVVYYSLLFIGTADSAPVSPREIFQRALLVGAHGVVLAHNHPSGDCTISAEDRKVHDELTEGGKLIGLQVLDSMVVTDSCYASIACD
jgi:DNA repair protein RadC